MAFETKPNQGALFVNKQHQDGDSKPNATGPLVVVCPCCQAQSKFDMSAWTKTTRAGDKFMSLSVKVAKGGAGTPPKEQPPSGPGESQTGPDQAGPSEERICV